jgi:hypothetical protein
MAGQGRNADGLAGAQSPDAPNVVQFPGNWFGPLGDLVPIDTGSERDEQAGYADDPCGFGGDAFWGEDAQDVHRVGGPGPAPAPAPRPGRRSPPRRMMVPVGAAVVVAAVVTAVLSSGIAAQPKRVSRDQQPQSPLTQLSGASQPTQSVRQIGWAGVAAKHRDDAGKSRTPRRVTGRRVSATAGPRTSAAAGYGASASAATRPPAGTAVPRTESVGTEDKAGLAANAARGDVASPTGLVSPPPNAARLNP